jgi:hypothetical protein
MIAVNLLYHEDTEYTDNKNNPLAMLAIPHVKWNPLFKGHTILVHASMLLNNRTFMNNCLSNDLLFGRGKGTFETTDGHSFTWISTDPREVS